MSELKEIVQVNQKHFDYLIEVAKKATCSRSKCGSIILKSWATPNFIEIIGEGYNSMPTDIQTDCFKDGLPDNFKSDKTCCIHAEQRAIIEAFKNHPKSVPGSDLLFIRLDDQGNPKHSGEPYCTICSKMALDAGISRFFLWHKEGWTAYDTKYYNELSFKYNP